MKSLIDLGFRPYGDQFCPSIEYAQYESKGRLIVFWKNGSVGCFKDLGQEYDLMTFEEILVCGEMIKERGWSNV